MNLLAHAYLSNNCTETTIGNLIADFVKGKLDNQYTHNITNGIKLHRKIDSYTDTHEIVLNCKKLFSKERRRFAGIIIDITFDHFLANKWDEYSCENLNEFAHRVYAILIGNMKIIPTSMHRIIPHMTENNWFVSYRNIDVIERAINSISYRLKKPNSIIGSIDEVKDNYQQLETAFDDFFPQLQTYSNQQYINLL